MYDVYLFRSLKSGKIYTGYTHDLKRRWSEHKSKSVHSPLRFGEVKLIFYEAFENRLDATERKQYLKTTKGKRTVKIMLKHSLAPFV